MDMDPDSDLDRTAAYYPNHPAQAKGAGPDPDRERGPDGRDPATGSPDMPTTTPPPAPANPGRYTYVSGARPLDGYTIKRAIGRGGFGEVYYATSDSGKDVALKLILRNLEVESRGVKQCMNLKCPNLLTVYDLRTNDEGDSFVVMEYVAGPSLDRVLSQHPGGMPVAEVTAWLKGLVEGVAYLHDHGIVHRDLKPANLFMEEGMVKIGDYGLAKLITPSQGTEHSESIGTCHYMAPEIASGKYAKPIDVYAIGVILFQMLTGRVPFDGESVGEILMKHLTARADVSMLPEPYRAIVAKALEKDPARRQQRVYDLLPPADAPRPPGVRFIGDGKTGPTLPEANGQLPKDDVLRIEAEESVFYIGPDTRPPRPPIGQRLRAAWRRPAIQPPPRRQPQPQPRPTPRVQAQVRRAVAPAPQPAVEVAPPEPPPLPGARFRLAELAGSMLTAAPVAALLSGLTLFAMGADPWAHPDHAALLFGLTLLSSWGVMAPHKLMEGRKIRPLVRHGAYLATGAAVGLTGWGLAALLDVNPGSLPGWHAPVELTSLFGANNPLLFVVYFALMFLLGGYAWMAARDRQRRVRLIPAARTTFFAGLFGLFMGFPQPWGLAVAGLTALTTQFTAPWSKQAAAYNRYAARAAKAGRRVA